jgi:hypothetical protein
VFVDGSGTPLLKNVSDRPVRGKDPVGHLERRVRRQCRLHLRSDPLAVRIVDDVVLPRDRSGLEGLSGVPSQVRTAPVEELEESRRVVATAVDYARHVIDKSLEPARGRPINGDRGCLTDRPLVSTGEGPRTRVRPHHVVGAGAEGVAGHGRLPPGGREQTGTAGAVWGTTVATCGASTPAARWPVTTQSGAAPRAASLSATPEADGTRLTSTAGWLDSTAAGPSSPVVPASATSAAIDS